MPTPKAKAKDGGAKNPGASNIGRANATNVGISYNQRGGQTAGQTEIQMGQGTHRVNVNFSDDAYEALKEIARSRDKSISEVLRDAIALEKWYEDTKRQGGRVIVELDDGRTREIVRP